MTQRRATCFDHCTLRECPAFRSQARALRGMLGHGAPGLEVGSYVGAFLVAARDEGLRFEGLDINAVTIWTTFDQLADPRAAANKAARLLRPGGVFAVRVPNGEFSVALRHHFAMGSRAERAAARALLAQNNLLTFPYRYGFSRDALMGLLEQQRFTVRCIHGDVLVSTVDEWTRPWARIEETLIKRALALIARRDGAHWAPWLDVFAVRDD